MSAGISVALATHDGERHLGEQLESLARQRLAPYELVVRDDRSGDGTLAILETFAARSPFPVRVEVNAQRLGYAETFLRAARSCSGELIAFCDQDDVWLPEKLERCAAALAVSPGAMLAIHANRIVGADLRASRARFPDVRASAVAAPLTTDPWLPVPGMAMVFSARLAAVDAGRRPRAHDLPGRLLRHDEWILMLARASGAIAFVGEVLGLYRQHGSNTMGAPGRGVAAALRQLRSSDWRYYAARAAQAREAADVFSALARAEPPGGPGDRYAAAAADHATLAELLERRVRVHAPGAPAGARAAALAGLVRDPAYRARFGSRAAAKDGAGGLLALAMGSGPHPISTGSARRR